MAVLTVGSGYATIQDAVNAAQAGDTVAVPAGVYTDEFVTIRTSLTLQAVGGEVQLRETVQPPDGKAMITEGNPGASITIQGFDISGVSVPDNNGAAVRYEGGNLTLVDDYFHGNQEGLLGNGDDPNGSISVQHSEFAANGDGSGFTHNFYAGAIASVTIDNSYFHDAIVGHEIKSRAASTTITNSRIFDNNGSASYSVDAPNGGNLSVSGNVIEQGPNSQNPAIFAWGEEGVTHAGSASVHDNTIVNDRAGGTLLVGGPIAFSNNQTWGIDAGAGNVVLAGRPSLDTSSLAFISQPASTPEPPAPPSIPPPEPPPPSPAPPPETPPPPPPALTLDQYHAQVFADFFAYFVDHHDVITNGSAIGAFLTEWTSPVVLTAPVPGDLWS